MKLIASVAALLLGTTAMAQTAAPAPAPAAPTVTFALKGFVSMSTGLEDSAYALYTGQGAIGATAFQAGQKATTTMTSSTNQVTTSPALDTIVRPNHDVNALIFDVRQSRFNFSVKSSQTVLGGATPTAVLELDFFGGFSAGAFGDASLWNRLRLAYSELNWGNHKLQFGQQNDLIFAMAPTSLSHIAFPLAFFTGNTGWRRPGVFGYHTFQVDEDVKVEAAWEVARSTWSDAAAAPGNNVPDPAFGTTGQVAQSGGHTRAEASAIPAVEARVTVAYKNIASAFVGAHYNQVDWTGQGGYSPPFPGGKTHFEVVSYNAGLKLAYMGATLQGSAFTGKNTAPLLGNFAEFKLGPKGEDVNASGYWVQAGYNLTKELGLWAMYGNQKPKESEARAAKLSKLENSTTNIALIYREGGYAIGAEWVHFETKLNGALFIQNNAAAPTADQTARGNQYLLTANYYF